MRRTTRSDDPAAGPPRRTLRKKLALLAAASTIALVILELGIGFLALSGRFNIHTPSYSLHNIQLTFWADINPDFGVWHKPHSYYRHTQPGINVENRANSHGARDIERSIGANGKSRVIVLGDSFVEGFGVEQHVRFTDVLESSTGIEHLNFGAAATFGPIQSYLLYKTLAKKFEHDAVIMCILPANDFLDNNFEHGKEYHHDRYRPYFAGEFPDYKLVYYRDELPTQPGAFKRGLSGVTGALREFTYTYNLLRYWRSNMAMRRAMRRKAVGIASDYSGYYDFTDADFDLMKFTIEKLAEEAADRTVVVATIPVRSDFRRSDEDGEPPLPKRMRTFCEGVGATYVDLFPYMYAYTNAWGTYFHEHDPHWNAFGHRVAAEGLREALQLYE